MRPVPRPVPEEDNPTRVGKVSCQITPGDLAPVYSLSPVTIMLRRLLFTGKSLTRALAGAFGGRVYDFMMDRRTGPNGAPAPKRAIRVYSLRGLGTHGYAAMRGCLPIALIVALAPTAALEALLDAEALANLMRRR